VVMRHLYYYCRQFLSVYVCVCVCLGQDVWRVQHVYLYWDGHGQAWSCRPWHQLPQVEESRGECVCVCMRACVVVVSILRSCRCLCGYVDEYGRSSVVSGYQGDQQHGIQTKCTKDHRGECHTYSFHGGWSLSR